MMLQIMLYAIVMAAALGAAGLCLERLAMLWELPRRAAWIVALLLSVCWPPLMILSASARPHAAATSMPAHSAPPPRINADLPAFSDVTSAPAATAATLRPVPQQVGRWSASVLLSDRNLLAAWAAVSLASALYLIAAQLRLRRRVAVWQQDLLHDQPVLISETTGPALTGVFRPRLVIPRWLLDEPSTTQLLVLEHERQHIAARDPLLIRAATLLLVAFPWNLPLWWQFRRMRRAIELDCDARVLGTGAAAQPYGEVLLTVVGRATRMPMGVIAMSEPVSALERRIQNLLPDPVEHVLRQTSAVTAVLILSVGTTFAMNAPVIPQRAVAKSTSAPAANTITVVATPAVTIEAARPAPPTRVRIPAMAAAAPATNVAQPAPPSKATTDDNSPRFTVRIQPKTPGMGPADEASWSKVRDALAARLQRVPGIMVLTPDTQDPADYEFTIKIPAGTNGFNIETRSLVPQPADAFMKSRTWGFFSNSNGTEGDLAKSIDSAIIGAEMQMHLPREPGMEERLVAQLANPQSSREDRAMALSHLLTGIEQHFAFGSNGLPPASDAFVRAAVDFASGQSDPRGRAETWGLVRDISSPGLIAPVIAALGKETNAEVHLVLVGILARNFSAEPQARAALESIARTDTRQLARMVAQRALTGDAGWNEYLLATLKNTQLTDTQRLEPLTYLDYSGRYPQEQPPLDEESVRILGSLLERAETSSAETGSAVALLQNGNYAIAPEVIYRLLAVREGRQVLFGVRNQLLSRQVARGPFDDSTHAWMEDIARRDPDSRIRETARAVLDSVAKRERDMTLRRQ